MGSNSGATGIILCFFNRWCCLVRLKARTFSMHLGGFQPSVKQLERESSSPNLRSKVMILDLRKVSWPLKVKREPQSQVEECPTERRPQDTLDRLSPDWPGNILESYWKSWRTCPGRGHPGFHRQRRRMDEWMDFHNLKPCFSPMICHPINSGVNQVVTGASHGNPSEVYISSGKCKCMKSMNVKNTQKCNNRKKSLVITQLFRHSGFSVYMSWH